MEAKRAGVAGHNEKYDHYVLQELSEEFGRLASSGSESGLPEGGSRRGSFKLSPRSMARRYSQLKKVGVESFVCICVFVNVCVFLLENCV
jgi:hypothetical protein